MYCSKGIHLAGLQNPVKVSANGGESKEKMEDKKMTLNEKIMEVLQAMDDEAILEMWNEFQRDYRYEDEVYTLGEVLECFLNDLTFAEALKSIDKDEFDLSDDYAVNTIYGWKTFSDIFDVVDLGELANYIENEQETFNYPELEELFEEMEEDEEDDEAVYIPLRCL